MTSLGDLPGRRSCTEEAQVALAPRRKLGLAPGQLAARGAAPAVSQYEIIDSDAILVCEEPSLTSFVASDRPSFRIHKGTSAQVCTIRELEIIESYDK